MRRIVAVLAFCTLSFAQTPAIPSVTAIRPLQAGEARGGDFGCTAGGRFTASGYSIRAVMKWAFDVTDFQLQNMPRWSGGLEGFFRIESQAEGAPATFTNAQCKRMVQAMLADRFQLKLHPEMRDTKVLALVVGKNGPKMVRPDEGSKTPGVQFTIDGGARPDAVGFLPGGERNPKGLTMGQLATLLPIANGFDGPPVVDHTGLEGLYQIKLEFGTTMRGRLRDERMQDVSTAVQTLGLKLEERTEPFPVLVIDSLEKPGEN